MWIKISLLGTNLRAGENCPVQISQPCDRVLGRWAALRSHLLSRGAFWEWFFGGWGCCNRILGLNRFLRCQRRVSRTHLLNMIILIEKSLILDFEAILSNEKT
jgi:hypothetical protein